MGSTPDWEGVYKVERGGVIGFIEVHEWMDWFDDDELNGDEPDGAWYCDYRIGDRIDGGVWGYEYGDTFDDLSEFLNLTFIERVARPGDEEYDDWLDWIQGRS